MYNLNDMVLRIKALKKERKLSNDTLSELSGVPKGTLAKILGSETKDPQISNIIKIAQTLGVSADYLIFGEAINKSSINLDLTESEHKILSMYRELSAHDQGRAIGYIESLHNNREPAEIIKIAARDGSFTETTITNSDIENINNLPDVDDI